MEYNSLRNLARRAKPKLLKSRSPLIVEMYGGYWLADQNNCAVAGHSPNVGMLEADEVRSICEHEIAELAETPTN